jgi:hypothetical protein
LKKGVLIFWRSILYRLESLLPLLIEIAKFGAGYSTNY